METVLLRDSRIELQQLDKAIHRLIPSGFSTRKSQHIYMREVDLDKLHCAKHADLARARLSLGTLGGGNHFIELGKDEDGRLYLVVHTGSRNLGTRVCEYYQKQAVQAMASGGDRHLAYLEGALFDHYLHDMALVQHYSNWNRLAIVREIVSELGLKIDGQFTTIHNYIDLDSMILRKGAISARAGERVLIPVNMRDGSLICTGKGNPDWNFSAPHGAGRLMSRTAAKSQITLTEFQKSMEGIYSSTVGKKTIDEAPFAYKPIEEIIANVGETVTIEKRVKPLYNFKAAE